MSAECDKCGTDLVGTQWDGLSCPVCEKADQIVADRALLNECREELLSQWKSNHAEHCTNILPCPQTQAGPLGCQWPRPAVLSLLDERLEK